MFSGFTTVKMSMAMARRFSLGEFGESKQGGVQGTLPFTPSILARAQTRARPGSVRLLLRYKAARVPMMPQFPFTFCSLLAGGPSNISLACLLSSLPVCLHLSHLEKTENCFISHPVLSPHYCTLCSLLIIVRPFPAKLLLHPLFGFRLPPQPCSSIPPNIFSSHANSTRHPIPPTQPPQKMTSPPPSSRTASHGRGGAGTLTLPPLTPPPTN